MQRKSLALSMWYLLVIDHLRAISGNPEDAKLMSQHVHLVIARMAMTSYGALSMASIGRIIGGERL
jgi:hypothetical protein